MWKRNVNLIELLISYWKSDEFLMQHFKDRIQLFEDCYNDAIADDHDFFYHSNQKTFIATYFQKIAFGLMYFTKYQASNMSFSLLNETSGTSVTIFFHFLEDQFVVVPNKIIVEEASLGFPHPGQVYVLKNTTSYRFLYAATGKYLSISGNELLLTSNCYGNIDSREFVLVYNTTSTFSAYNSSLTLLLEHCDDYDLLGGGYNIALKKDHLFFVANTSKGLIPLKDCVEVTLHQDRFHLHNNAEFFILKNTLNKYAIFHLSKWITVYDFELDEVYHNTAFDYFFVRKEQQLIKMNLNNLNIELAEKVVFDQRIY